MFDRYINPNSELIAYIRQECRKLNIEVTPDILFEASDSINCFTRAITDWLITAHLSGFDNYSLEGAIEKSFANSPDNVIQPPEMDVLQKKLRDEFGYTACKHCFTFYKNDEVACKKMEVIGAGYLSFWCQDCESFEAEDIEFWIDELDPDGLDTEEAAALATFLATKEDNPDGSANRII